MRANISATLLGVSCKHPFLKWIASKGAVSIMSKQDCNRYTFHSIAFTRLHCIIFQYPQISNQLQPTLKMMDDRCSNANNGSNLLCRIMSWPLDNNISSTGTEPRKSTLQLKATPCTLLYRHLLPLFRIMSKISKYITTNTS